MGGKRKCTLGASYNVENFFFLLIVDVLGALKGKSEEMDGWRGNEIEGK